MNYEFDLDINNYDLEDILNLLHLPLNFTKEQLMTAKRTVLMTHPDKSGQPKEVFLFFSKAYKIIHQIYTFRSRSDTSCAKNTIYTADDIDGSINIDSSILDKFTKTNDFNKKFNALWEQYNLKFGEDEGYGDWLKDESEDNKLNAKTMDELNEHINERKKQIRDLVIINNISDSYSIGNYGHSNLSKENPGCFEAPVFGGLQYDDVRRAYTESVVPVTEDDYKSIRKFSNQDELQRFRGMDFNEHFINSEHEKKFRDMSIEDTENNTRRAYDLVKQDEQLRKVKDGWSAALIRLQNN